MFTVLLAAVSVVALASVWGGFVLQVLWAWFVVPTFGLPALTLPVAIGVGLVVDFLTYHYVPTDNNRVLDALLWAFVYPLIALIMGFVVHLFM